MTLQFVMFALTVWSVTRLFTTDGFPPIDKTRNRILDAGTLDDGYRWFAYLAICQWCLSFWVAIAVWATAELVTDLSFPAPAGWILAARVTTGVADLIEDRLSA
jgi:hypothetical protein